MSGSSEVPGGYRFVRGQKVAGGSYRRRWVRVKTFVCLKQVAAGDSTIRVEESGHWIREFGLVDKTAPLWELYCFTLNDHWFI